MTFEEILDHAALSNQKLTKHTRTISFAPRRLRGIVVRHGRDIARDVEPACQSRKEEPMKNFPWEDLLRRHPIFSHLSAKEIDQLLEDKVSEEKECPQHSVILREGELGDSIFLIGSGSVQIVLNGKDGREILLAIFRNGDVFGEMGLFQQRPRSATVIANEPCILLEIKGDEFLKLAHMYPDMELKMLLSLSERLRHVNEQVLAVRLKEVDEKLNFFNTKLDAELKVFDASMRAASTIFDQTRVRTDEIINSAERSRTRASFILTTAIALLGLLGATELLSIKNIWKEAADIREEQLNIAKVSNEITHNATTVQDLTDKTQGLSKELDAFRGKIGENRDLIVETREKIADHIFLPAFSSALKNQDTIQAAMNLYDDLRPLKSDVSKLTLYLLVNEITGEMTTQPKENRINYTELLWQILEYAQTPEEKMTAYFLLLTNAILVDMKQFENGKTFDNTLAQFKNYVRENRGIHMQKQVVEPLKKLFDGESHERKVMFQRLTELISPLK
jgi:CRP-like cAMP-binding protein